MDVLQTEYPSWTLPLWDNKVYFFFSFWTHMLACLLACCQQFTGLSVEFDQTVVHCWAGVLVTDAEVGGNVSAFSFLVLIPSEFSHRSFLTHGLRALIVAVSSHRGDQMIHSCSKVPDAFEDICALTKMRCQILLLCSRNLNKQPPDNEDPIFKFLSLDRQWADSSLYLISLCTSRLPWILFQI